MTLRNVFAQPVICVLLMIALSSASDAAAQEGGILILQSRYGSDSSGCDPTAALFRSCNGRAKCSVAADNSLCGDPHEGAVKALKVVYRCGRHGSDRIADAIEHQPPVLLSCPLPVPTLTLTAHLQDVGDVSGTGGAWVGTKGLRRRLEGFSIEQPTSVPLLGIEYMCHVQDAGDTRWMSGGTFCGTRGQGRRLEGFSVRLTGENAGELKVVYECHLEDVGDIGPLQDGAYCGTRGQARRLEAIKISIVAR